MTKVKNNLCKVFLFLSLSFLIFSIFIFPDLKQNLNSDKISEDVKIEMLKDAGFDKLGRDIVDNLPLEDFEEVSMVGHKRSRILNMYFRLGNNNLITTDLIVILVGLNVLSLLFLSFAWKFYYESYLCEKCESCREKMMNHVFKQDLKELIEETNKQVEEQIQTLDELLNQNKQIGITNIESMSCIAEGMSTLKIASKKIQELTGILIEE